MAVNATHNSRGHGFLVAVKSLTLWVAAVDILTVLLK